MARFGTFFHGSIERQERACLASFLAHGHDVTVFSYAALDLPAGVKVRDAADILPADLLYVARRGPHAGSVSQFSNHFRYRMIQETGLAWIDTDLICLRADWPESDVLLGWQDNTLVNGAVIRLPPGHPFLADAIAVCERMAGLAVWGLTGAHLLTALVNEHDLWRDVQPRDAFYPLHFRYAAKLLAPLEPGYEVRVPKGAYCVHLWNEMLRLAGHDRHRGPAPGSGLAALLDFAARGAGAG